MEIKRKTIVLAVTLASILTSAIDVFSTTWYVKPDQTGDAPTIQAAIDSTRVGDTVLVAPGTYKQSWIECGYKDTLSIIGEEGAENTILQVTDPPLHMLVHHCDSLFLKGFTFENSLLGGVKFYLCSRVSVIENIFRFNQGDAINFEVCSGVVMNSNLIYSNTYGISCVDQNYNVTISNNTIAGQDEYGLYLYPANRYVISNNIVYNNAIGVHSFAVDHAFACNNAYNNGVNYQLLFFPDPTGTDGNISVDPQFCGVDPEASGNFLLQSDSPCAPGNHPTGYLCGLIGKFPVGCSATLTEEQSWGKIKSIFR